MKRKKSREEYRLFLETPFWKDLSLACRNKAGFKCQRCGKLDHCQAHHKFYREDWDKTELEDLECICRECHEKHHERPVRPPKPVRQFSRHSGKHRSKKGKKSWFRKRSRAKRDRYGNFVFLSGRQVYFPK